MHSVFQEFEFLEIVDSTNAYLRRYVDSGVARVVRAGEQTGGKGRQDRLWFSPPNEGLYVSYLLFPQWDPAEAAILNEVASLAVIESIGQLADPTGTQIRLKLPNDVLVNGRKVCGILVELSTLPGSIRWAIIGVGVNLLQRSFPDDLEFRVPPSSLCLEGLGEIQPSLFCEVLTVNLERLYREVDSGDRLSVREKFSKAALPA